MKVTQNFKHIIQSIGQTSNNTKINYKTEKDEISKEIDSFNLLVTPTSTHNQNNSVFNNNVCSLPSVWSDWSYKPKLVANVDSDIFFSSNEQIDVSNDAFVNLSQLSVWSDWSYHPDKFNFNNNSRNLHCKWLSISENVNKCNFERDALIKPKLAECRISSNTINSLQIIKQINKEFIVAVANDNGKKLIILIDQHAIHERIRYEWLIEAYREKGRHSYVSEKLHKDLLITDIDKNLLKLICIHKEIPMRVGIHVKGFVNSSTCIVDAVPRCFLKRKRYCNDDQHIYRLKKNVKQLLLEVAKGLSHNVLPPILPITINNVIASEACHGKNTKCIRS
ncbi:DNA mismatch repair protein Mlh3-like [Phymastichus coffea]|uniref:DNA mismatch repair protein Mlh3-like n=1 Tax=Phymastichus coffea TaxID=108790 RepID=UPI00273C5902|nr:DNA mismatch repair protein Mlh3-like [Phymastichus coffea]